MKFHFSVYFGVFIIMMIYSMFGSLLYSHYLCVCVPLSRNSRTLICYFIHSVVRKTRKLAWHSSTSRETSQSLDAKIWTLLGEMYEIILCASNWQQQLWIWSVPLYVCMDSSEHSCGLIQWLTYANAQRLFENYNLIHSGMWNQHLLFNNFN